LPNPWQGGHSSSGFTPGKAPARPVHAVHASSVAWPQRSTSMVLIPSNPSMAKLSLRFVAAGVH